MKWKVGFEEFEFDPVQMETFNQELYNLSPKNSLMREKLWMQKLGAIKILQVFKSKEGVEWCQHSIVDMSILEDCKRKLKQLDAYRFWKKHEKEKII